MRTAQRTPTAKDPYHHGNLRAALLEAVEELIAEDGVDSVTLRSCARRAGVSHGAPAHHFGSLRGLLTEFAIQGFERLSTAMNDALETSIDRLYATGLGYIRFAMEAPEQFRLMWRWGVLDMSSPQLLAGIQRTGNALREALVAANLHAHQQVLDEATVDARFSQAWCGVHGYACLWVEGARHETLPVPESFLLAMRPSLIEPPPRSPGETSSRSRSGAK